MTNPPYISHNAPLPADESGEVDLDALLATSVQHAQDLKTIKKGKDKLQSPWMGAKERDELRASVAAAESRREWEPTAAVALFAEQLCVACGARHRHFQGFFQEQAHTSSNHAVRWIPSTDHTMVDNLPKKLKLIEELADTCSMCISTIWCDTSPATQTEFPIATRTPHKNTAQHSNQYQFAGEFGRKG